MDFHLIKYKKLIASILFAQIISSPICYASIIQNGAWVYDGIYDQNGNRSGTLPGLFKKDIVEFNQCAMPSHRITNLFAYGGTLKMNCQGSGISDPSTPCNTNTLTVTYNTASTLEYYNALNTNKDSVEIDPIVDGVIGGNSLKTFNTLDKNTAQLFADKVAAVYCADNNIGGVQFDLEPFDITMPGQAAFYAQIAKDFAGKHNAAGVDPYGCVNPQHPNGRTFSVFTTGAKVNAKLGEILNKYNNGHVIGSLYTLIKYTGVATPPVVFRKNIDNEIKRMLRNANTYHVKFQFGIPASSSIEEFESMNDIPSGYQQLEYVRESIESITHYTKDQSNFIGIDFWGWSERRIKQKLNAEFKPSRPPETVLNYLMRY
jgi:hypothetical protein